MATCTVFRGSGEGIILRETREISADLFGDEVLLDITAAGLCGTDEHFRHHNMVLGHEGIGIVRKVGPNVRKLHEGDRVGWGYQHDSCGMCKECFAGKEIHCPEGEFYGTSNTDQGAFATQAIWRELFLFRIPENLTDTDAVPLMCAGSTVFSGLQKSYASPGERIGILGMGGLGHLAIQFASKQGYKPIVLSRTRSKESTASGLGATEFHVIKEPPSLGNDIQLLDVLLVTASQVTDWNYLIDLMAPRGRVVIMSILETNIEIPALRFVTKSLQMQGTVIAPRGTNVEMLKFASDNGIRPIVQQFPLSVQGITKAMDLMKEGKLEYRAVFVAE